MKFWLHIHNTLPEQGLELAVLAEQLGFEGVVSDDHWFMPAASATHDPNERAPLPMDYVFPDIFAFGGAVLARTQTLKFGSCIMVLANRTNVFLVAKAAATLARISDDRFVMGVGTGWMRDEYDMAGVSWESRVPRTVEMMEILRKLWGPGPVEHHGRFFDFPATYAEPRPSKPVPIYMGSVVPAALRRTGMVADGWMGMTSRLSELADQIALINVGREEAGRRDKAFEFMVGLARNDDGTLPSPGDYQRAAEMGVTQHHVGPIDHALGVLRSSFDDKKRFVEDFARRIMRTA
ncbi:TIGR03619 family F420-dependent LLM class oxidoreductase (plasmid) [Sphingobium sp. SJ10-10]|uniref:TIGR03619 family F420-dependent LLM class oxidoreductase n=1 Tax=Sphingobium sp. SJ10-10 TaxID=3114999 RepID=UPI002E17F51A|nr:TIGR03619 family F420-dependent LLM class oxidoreductase [Sphingobium sp. SJ10-10]